jgi:hypothetical protein
MDAANCFTPKQADFALNTGGLAAEGNETEESGEFD